LAPTPPDLHMAEPETPPRHDASASLSGRRGLALLIKSGVGLAVGAARGALLHVDHWFLAYRTRPDKFIARSLELSGEGLEIFCLDPARFHADPCVFEHAGVDHVFFEEFSYKKRKGVISWSQLQSDGTLSRPSDVLEEPMHLSYPFVFSHQGAVYMVPETSRQREIALYRSARLSARVAQGRPAARERCGL
jgi:hypothetical protein